MICPKNRSVGSGQSRSKVSLVEKSFNGWDEITKPAENTKTTKIPKIPEISNI